MADFRRCILALAVVALLVTAASAQNVQPFSCNASAAVPPLLRSEGLTELTGDIVLTCTGSGLTGNANVSVFLGNTTITSRILDSTTSASEALLLIDEPGPTAGTPLSTSPAYNVCASVQGLACPTANVFKGIITGNQVTFLGIPVNPPGTTGVRIYRITNVRANASAVGTGASGTPGQVTAFISITGSTSIPINNAQQTVGFVQKGLNFLVRKPDDSTSNLGALNLPQCTDIGRTALRGLLQFQENFATSFKVQGTTLQTLPGQIYNTESGLTVPGVSGTTPLGVSVQAGLADFGTRLRAVFNNVPNGVNIFVTTKNVDPANSLPIAATSGSGANLVNNFQAVLVASEVGPAVLAQPNPNTDFKDQAGKANTNILASQLTVTGGSATAVWEVINTGTNGSLTIDNAYFGFYMSATANPANNVPAAGTTATVAGNFAPAPPAISATDGAKASSTLPIPRFADSSSAVNFLNIVVCRTNLLFPFVTNQAGFDTGMAIANTSKDIFGTANQAGTCTLNFFGDNAPAPVTTASLAAGSTYTALAQSVAPNFQGYVIAQCQFQFAHGFAFVSDVGARNLAMGYLALVIPDKANGKRESAVTLSSSGTGEVLGQ